MLSITINQPMKVKYARKGQMPDGTPWALVTIAENENSESKSKSVVKCWGSELPEGAKDGCEIKIIGLSEIRLVHEKYGEKYGRPLFRDAYEIRGAIFEM